jgi:hypothetical protein
MTNKYFGYFTPISSARLPTWSRPGGTTALTADPTRERDDLCPFLELTVNSAANTCGVIPALATPTVEFGPSLARPCGGSLRDQM